jgi:hypothetical protein
VLCDNKEEVIKMNQHSEVKEYTEKKYRITATRKRKENRKLKSVI